MVRQVLKVLLVHPVSLEREVNKVHRVHLDSRVFPVPQVLLVRVASQVTRVSQVKLVLQVQLVQEANVVSQVNVDLQVPRVCRDPVVFQELPVLMALRVQVVLQVPMELKALLVSRECRAKEVLLESLDQRVIEVTAAVKDLRALPAKMVDVV